jgi:hypothetical protein
MGSMAEAFGWTAEQFWQSTAHEVWAVIEARQRANDRINGD